MFKWSYRIGTLAGIGVYIHVTFVLVFAWLAIFLFLKGSTVLEIARGGLYLAVLFGIVVLHELGHALAARRYGVGTRDITLLPIGGVARLERMPEKPWQEFVVAIAGPAVNVALAGVALVAILLLRGLPGVVHAETPFMGGPLQTFFWINVALTVFNMLPAFPMDGGRVLRALLAMRLEYVHATDVAARVGQAMAVLFGFVGLFINPFLVIIAVFVWLGASQEAQHVRMRTALSGIPIAYAMITDYKTLAPDDRLARAVDHLLAGFQEDFPVVDQGRVVGVLHRGDLFNALAQDGQDGQVSEIMDHDFLSVAPDEMLTDIMERMQDRKDRIIPVISGSELQGILTLDNLGEFLMVQNSLHDYDVSHPLAPPGPTPPWPGAGRG